MFSDKRAVAHLPHDPRPDENASQTQYRRFEMISYTSFREMVKNHTI